MMLSSLLSYAATAVDRCLACFVPLFHRAHSNVRRVRRALANTWVLPVLLPIAQLLVIRENIAMEKFLVFTCIILFVAVSALYFATYLRARFVIRFSQISSMLDEERKGEHTTVSL